MDNQEFFWSVYLQDNYHFKNLNIQKRGLILEYRLKMRLNAIPISKILKKGVQIGPNFKPGFVTQKG